MLGARASRNEGSFHPGRLLVLQTLWAGFVTALAAARERLVAYVLSYASPGLNVGDGFWVAEQVARDRASAYPPEVLRRLVDDVVEATRHEVGLPF